jgi:tetratricopeptide (TPR) repeat protein
MKRIARSAMLVSFVAGAAAAQSPAPQTIPGLGTITFPTSTKSAAAQTAFIRGVLLLHVFEYDDAAASFRAAQKLDSGFVMAYWGEAMTYTHPVWDQQDLAAAQAVLARLGPTTAHRLMKPATQREHMYLMAVEWQYDKGPKAKRDTLYAEAMHKLVLAYPNDDEARAFYALSLLGLSQGVRNVPTYLTAAAIAESIYHRNPNHPGAEHYWIHGMDDPEHAPAALTAARALSKTAPEAGHSQHMTTHIFLAMGMWDDVVSQNEIAIRVVDSIWKSRGRGPVYCGHYASWLAYGYGMQGRLGLSKKSVSDCRADAVGPEGAPKMILDADNSKRASFVSMWARDVLHSQDWNGDVAKWTIDPGNEPMTRLDYQFVGGYAAAQRGDLPAARAALAAYDSATRALNASLPANSATDPETIEFQKGVRVLRLELLGLIAVKSGAIDSGLALLKRATVVEDSTAAAFGPPSIDEPSYELYGEQLVAAGHPKEAMAAFHTALARAPRRTPALLGLARAAAKAGDASTAMWTYQTLVDIWHAADAGLPGLEEARVGAGGIK